MKIAHFDCFSGISGDMCLGALLEAGVPLSAMKRELNKISLKGYNIKTEKVSRSGISALKAHVSVRNEESPARKLGNVRSLINSSSLPPAIKKKGLKIFCLLFEAEAAVHGTTPGRVHLHELSATDALVDIMGTIIGLDMLGVERITCSAINLGSGTVRSAHGVLPVPAPATAWLLAHRGIPACSDGKGELCTPTGAALMAGLANEFCSLPEMSIKSIGAGAGSMDTRSRPNILRLFTGEAASAAPDEGVSVIEANIDDMSPEIAGYVIERLMEAGALDAWAAPVMMKKSRPGMTLSAISQEADSHKMISIMLSETSTLGLRHYRAGRVTLPRKSRRVRTPYGIIGIKEAYALPGGGLIKSAPEYEDCRRAAIRHKVPLREVMAAALKKASLKN